VNRPEEMLAYMEALLALDSHGEPVALNPVLVKGPKVWYFDPLSPTGVSWFPSEGAGPMIRPYEVFGLDHNILPKEYSMGTGPAGEGCMQCHTVIGAAQLLDRAVLLDPFDENGQPVYSTVRELNQFHPP
jgi:hypothetical protein